MKRIFAIDRVEYLNRHINLFQSVVLRVIVVLLLFPSLAVAQEAKSTISGHLIDKKDGKKLSDVLIVNKTSGNFAYGDENGNYTIEAKKKDVLVFSALGYSSVNFSLIDSVFKLTYFVVPQLNRYSIIIKEVSIKAERAVTEITDELNLLTRSHQYQQQAEAGGPPQMAISISAMHNKWSKREQGRRNVEHLKYLSRKRILLRELIRKSKLSQTELLSKEEQDAFVEYLLKYEYLLRYSNQYELLARINDECKRWMGVTDTYDVRSRSK